VLCTFEETQIEGFNFSISIWSSPIKNIQIEIEIQKS